MAQHEHAEGMCKALTHFGIKSISKSEEGDHGLKFTPPLTRPCVASMECVRLRAIVKPSSRPGEICFRNPANKPVGDVSSCEDLSRSCINSSLGFPSASVEFLTAGKIYPLSPLLAGHDTQLTCISHGFMAGWLCQTDMLCVLDGSLNAGSAELLRLERLASGCHGANLLPQVAPTASCKPSPS